MVRLRPEALTISRDEFIAKMKERGIGTSVHFIPIHHHPYYRETYGLEPSQFPVAASLWPRLVSLPLFPGMTRTDVDIVSDAIRSLRG